MHLSLHFLYETKIYIKRKYVISILLHQNQHHSLVGYCFWSALHNRFYDWKAKIEYLTVCAALDISHAATISSTRQHWSVLTVRWQVRTSRHWHACRRRQVQILLDNHNKKSVISNHLCLCHRFDRTKKYGSNTKVIALKRNESKKTFSHEQYNPVVKHKWAVSKMWKWTEEFRVRNEIIV